MYRDTEQSYQGFTLDIFDLAKGGWQCDWWERSNPDNCGTIKTDRRKLAIQQAKDAIDAYYDKKVS
jgi:hypothetical protein